MLIVLASCGLGEGDIKSDLKRLDLSDSGEQLVLQGKWRNVTGRPSVTVPRVNSVRIECDKGSLICTEYIAKLIQKSDDPSSVVDKRYLFLMKEGFRILEWSDSAIVARAEPRAADIELRISLKDDAAERTSRETEARGAAGANPSEVEHWVLD
jgi:hypothetical protein